MKAQLLIFLVCLNFLNSFGQDVHWSQFNEIPVYQNPASSGHFFGDFRFNANYRNQWKSVSVPFSTFSLSVDAPIKKYTNLGAGFLFLNDIAGDGKLRTNELLGSLSYRLKLASDSTKSIRFGLSVGLNYRQIDWGNLYFDNQFNGYNFDPTLSANETFQTDRKANITIASGAVYNHKLNKKQRWSIGLAFFNINRPNQGFYNQKIPRDIRINLVSNMNIQIDPDWELTPAISITAQGKYKEVVAGSSIKYTLINKTGYYRALSSGVWYRLRDAAYLTFGLNYQDWFVGLSYDINFSKLIPASNYRGAFELSTRYILHYFKPKKIKYRACPDYI